MRKATPARQLGSGTMRELLPGYLFLLLAMATLLPRAAAGPFRIERAHNSRQSDIDLSWFVRLPHLNDDDDPAALAKWQGLPVREISFEGVSADRLQPLPGHLPQEVGAPLDREKVAQSLRTLFRDRPFRTALKWMSPGRGRRCESCLPRQAARNLSERSTWMAQRAPRSTRNWRRPAG